MCIDGAFEIEYDMNIISIKRRYCVLIPAAMDYYVISGKASF
jgi:mannose-6-phosphate isomerase